MAEFDWVKWRPGRFLHGTFGMGPHDGWLYTVILNLIYEHGGPIVNDTSVLAKRCNMRPSAVEKSLKTLSKLGKISHELGRISNETCEEVMQEWDKTAQRNAKNSKEGWKKRKQKQPPDDANALQPALRPAKAIRGEEKREEENKEKDICPKTALPPSDDTNSKSDPTKQPPSTVMAKPRPRKTATYSEDFETFWKAYPTDPGMSKREAAIQWEHIPAEDRRTATEAIPGFCLWVKKQGATYRTVHACRFLSQRRFEGFVNGHAITDEKWAERMEIARRRNQWDVKNWGIIPGQSGCRVPSHLLKPDDGKDWTEWRQGS